MQKSKVTIVGAGIPGLVLALILADQSCAITIIDKNPLPTAKTMKPSARTAALMQGSLNVLERAGVWPGFKGAHARLAELEIIDDSTYPRGADNMIHQNFKATELGLDEFGHNIPLMPMTVALADKARKHKNITILDKTDIDQNHDDVYQADLIVGADGRHSIVRQWAEIEANIKHYDQSAITCIIGHSKSHDNRSIEFHRPGGPCTFVPYADHQSAVVWVDDKSIIDDVLKLPKNSFLQALQSRSRDFLGQIEDVIVGPESWPLMTLKTQTLIAPKTVLIAEAAHVASPIGAQGLNMSLRDVDVLANHIDHALRNGQDIGSMAVLKSYEQRRNQDVLPRLKAIDFLHNSVANDDLIMRGLRRLGLQTLSMASPLRSFLMQEGLAPKT